MFAAELVICLWREETKQHKDDQGELPAGPVDCDLALTISHHDAGHAT